MSCRRCSMNLHLGALHIEAEDEDQGGDGGMRCTARLRPDRALREAFDLCMDCRGEFLEWLEPWREPKGAAK